MKKKILLLVALVAMALPSAAENYNFLTLVTDGGSTSVARTAVRKLTFDDGELVITRADGTRSSVELSALTRITFSDTPADGVRSLSGSDASLLHLQSGRLAVAGTGLVLLYDAQGRMVRQESVSTSRSEINVSDLPRGIYIARLGSQTLKFLR